jgi:hypothetical protein
MSLQRYSKERIQVKKLESMSGKKKNPKKKKWMRSWNECPEKRGDIYKDLV